MKSVNWLTSQIEDGKKPIVIAKPRNQKESSNLQTLQDQLPNNLTLLIIKDNTQQEQQKLLDLVNDAIVQNRKALENKQ